MKKALFYTVLGTVLSFLINYFFWQSGDAVLDLYYGFAFGLGWGMAYFLDRPEWPLVKKMGISFIGIFALVGLGLIFFDFEKAVPTVIKFSTVFVAYYLIASFRESKSLRQ